jgi:hypothetical protein
LPIGSSECAALQAALPGREKRVYSQEGEDGVVVALIEQIQPAKKYYVEFGTQSGAEINTRYIREKHGWTGLLMDGGVSNPSINLHQTMILEETIVAEFEKHKVPKDLGLLSVDIDSCKSSVDSVAICTCILF